MKIGWHPYLTSFRDANQFVIRLECYSPELFAGISVLEV
jgi:hypothetical protein